VPVLVEGTMNMADDFHYTPTYSPNPTGDFINNESGDQPNNQY